MSFMRFDQWRLMRKIGLTIYCKLIRKMQGDQDGLLELVILNFIFKCDN
jgi:hypothetical protein